MSTSQFWQNHYSSVDPKLQETFLKLNTSHCREILIALNLSTDNEECYESSENRVFGFERVIIKFFRPGRWSLEALEEEVLFLEDLKEADVAFVRSVGGVRIWNGVYYIIYERVNAAEFKSRKILDEKSVRQMVHLVARIHEVGAKRGASARAQFDPCGVFEGCFEVIKKNGFLPRSLEQRYLEASKKIAGKFDAIGEITVQRIHGDTYSDNIIWNDSGPTFMDLDDFQIGPVAIDIRLLSFPWRLGTLPESMSKRESRIIQHNMVLDMYREVARIPEESEKLFPLLGAYRDIQFDAWFSARWKEPGFAENYEDDDITTIDWWKDSIEGLEEALR